MFTALINLNLSSTAISNRHLQQIIRVAANLDSLTISFAPKLHLPNQARFEPAKTRGYLRKPSIYSSCGCMSLLLQKSSNHCNLWIEVKSGGIAFPNENIWLSFQRNIGDRNRGWLRCRERDKYVCRRSVWRRTVVLAFFIFVLLGFCLRFCDWWLEFCCRLPKVYQKN